MEEERATLVAYRGTRTRDCPRQLYLEQRFQSQGGCLAQQEKRGDASVSGIWKPFSAIV